MITKAKTVCARVYEDAGCTIMARLYGQDAALVTQATISSIAYRIAVLSTDTEIASGTLTVGSVIFDTLQTDARWTADSTGYNFRWTIPAASLPTGATTYNVDVTFNPASGEAFCLPPHELTTINRLN